MIQVIVGCSDHILIIILIAFLVIDFTAVIVSPVFVILILVTAIVITITIVAFILITEILLYVVLGIFTAFALANVACVLNLCPMGAWVWWYRSQLIGGSKGNTYS